jgi:drug/metabolite transporter (DMT)-like permease
MSTLAHDAPRAGQPARSRFGVGLVLALVAAVSFGMSGAVARGLLEVGWSVGAVTVIRIGLGALVVLPFGLVALRGRWHLLRANAGMLMLYGALAVAVAQFCYFSAVQHMQVGPALLIEYTAPAAVVVWMWLVHGQRPGRLTLAGAAVAAVGLVLVLDLVSGADLSIAGVLWALGAMVGCASFFIIAADERRGIPPMTLAAGGLLFGAVLIGALGLVGLLPMHGVTTDPTYAGSTVPWWLPLLALGVLSAAVPYTSGVVATRHLGSRLASFIALNEVVAGVLWAWLLLSELPGAVQLVGGLLILAGVIGVKAGEPRVVTEEPSPV